MEGITKAGFLPQGLVSSLGGSGKGGDTIGTADGGKLDAMRSTAASGTKEVGKTGTAPGGLPISRPLLEPERFRAFKADIDKLDHLLGQKAVQDPLKPGGLSALLGLGSSPVATVRQQIADVRQDMARVEAAIGKAVAEGHKAIGTGGDEGQSVTAELQSFDDALRELSSATKQTQTRAKPSWRARTYDQWYDRTSSWTGSEKLARLVARVFSLGFEKNTSQNNVDTSKFDPLSAFTRTRAKALDARLDKLEDRIDKSKLDIDTRLEIKHLISQIKEGHGKTIEKTVANGLGGKPEPMRIEPFLEHPDVGFSPFDDAGEKPEYLKEIGSRLEKLTSGSSTEKEVAKKILGSSGEPRLSPALALLKASTTRSTAMPPELRHTEDWTDKTLSRLGSGAMNTVSETTVDGKNYAVRPLQSTMYQGTGETAADYSFEKYAASARVSDALGMNVVDQPKSVIIQDSYDKSLPRLALVMPRYEGTTVTRLDKLAKGEPKIASALAQNVSLLKGLNDLHLLTTVIGNRDQNKNNLLIQFRDPQNGDAAVSNKQIREMAKDDPDRIAGLKAEVRAFDLDLSFSRDKRTDFLAEKFGVIYSESYHPGPPPVVSQQQDKLLRALLKSIDEGGALGTLLANDLSALEAGKVDNQFGGEIVDGSPDLSALEAMRGRIAGLIDEIDNKKTIRVVPDKAFEPDGGKDERASLTSGLAEAGKQKMAQTGEPRRTLLDLFLPSVDAALRKQTASATA